MYRKQPKKGQLERSLVIYGKRLSLLLTESGKTQLNPFHNVLYGMAWCCDWIGLFWSILQSAISRIPKWSLQPDFTLVIFPIDMTSYWTYQGSLTTPPMSENVIWIISENIMKISEKQVSLLLSIWAFILFIMTLNGCREKMAGDNAQ